MRDRVTTAPRSVPRMRWPLGHAAANKPLDIVVLAVANKPVRVAATKTQGTDETDVGGGSPPTTQAATTAKSSTGIPRPMKDTAGPGPINSQSPKSSPPTHSRPKAILLYRTQAHPNHKKQLPQLGVERFVSKRAIDIASTKWLGPLGVRPRPKNHQLRPRPLLHNQPPSSRTSADERHTIGGICSLTWAYVV